MEVNNTCHLSEIYSAIQGEGPLVGTRQLFVRFSACDLRCVWCDTPGSLVRTKFCEVESSAGSRSFKKIQNPIESNKLISYIRKFSPKLHHSISLTGGEPLLQHKFLLSFLPMVKKEFSLPIYLEAGGHRVDELKTIIKFLDYVSMDFKLPSSAKAGNLWDKHKEFLSLSLSSKKLQNVWIKIVLTNDTCFEELLNSVNLIKSIDRNNKKPEIFLQPVTQINGSKPPGSQDLLNIQFKLLKHYSNIRVLPQVHKFMEQK